MNEAKKNGNARYCFIVCLCYVCIFCGGSGNGFPRAVGTPITERPPHRIVRAAFPHTAPTQDV